MSFFRARTLTSSHALTLAFTTVLASSAGTALAQDPPQLDAQRFDPVPQMGGFVRIREGELPDHLRFGLIGLVSYGLHPVEVNGTNSYARDQGILDHLVGIDVAAAVALTRWLHLGVELPLLQFTGWNAGADPFLASIGAERGAVGFGDIELSFAFQALRQERQGVSLSVTPRFVLPTGTRKRLLGTGALGLGVDAALARRWRRFRFAVNLGFQVQSSGSVDLGVIEQDSLRFGVGLGVPLGAEDRWEITLEWVGSTVIWPNLQGTVGQGRGRAHTPMELTVGAQYHPKPDMTVYFGVGPGLSSGFGTPDLRVYGGFGWNMQASYDQDGDGLADRDDGCPTQAEDFDGFEDSDGCPERDNDRDRIDDVDDGSDADGDGFGDCLNSPEDLDGWEDEDGCPELDNDGDGVPDAEDGADGDGDGFGACRDMAEDRDGFEDDDGCPELDNDGDGVPDVRDGPDEDGDGFGDCRDEPEVENGVDDEDGCPDEALAELDEDTGQIVIYEKVFFALNRATIRDVSFPVLDAVVTIMAQYPQVELVEIQGHTDKQGRPGYNQTLSQSRAEAVRDYLVEAGIESERLNPIGYGEALLLDEGDTEEAHALNRRVQFVIRRMDGEDVVIEEGE